MSLWQRIFGRNQLSADYEERLQQARDARLDCYQKLVANRTQGDAQVEERRTLVEFQAGYSGPAWPQSPAWRRINTGTSTVLVSDGLSDPFPRDKPTQSGYGLEILMETTDTVPADYHSHWLFHLLYQVSQNVAHHGGFRKLIDQHQVGMLEVQSLADLQHLQNEAGQVGIFLGLHNGHQHDRIDYGRCHALVVTAKLLTASELAYAAANGAIGYRLLRECFLSQGESHYSNLQRESVI